MPWMTAQMRAPHAMIDLEVADEAPAAWPAGARRAHVLARWRGRPIAALWVSAGEAREPGGLRGLARRVAEQAIVARSIEAALAPDVAPPQAPDLTIAVCTRDRPALLGRCLRAIRAQPGGDALDVLVVDNAPSDDATRQAAAREGARHVVEPVPGLDFARNRALAETRCAYLAFLDDDAVVDAGWLAALTRALARDPDAACVTGPVAPLTLETEAQRRFEQAGGFGKGFVWRRFRDRRFNDHIFPASAGVMGTGANMVFSTRVLRAIGGFDEALDTGPPLPGGGDLDAYYRIVRSGGALIYEPDLLVFHEHRRDLAGLRRQYWSWGLSIGALARKHMAADPEMAGRHLLTMRWILHDRLRRLARAALGRGPRLPSGLAAELLGALWGFAGEYGRSRRRISRRKAVVNR